jgi:hypothetical protein
MHRRPACPSASHTPATEQIQHPAANPSNQLKAAPWCSCCRTSSGNNRFTSAKHLVIDSLPADGFHRWRTGIADRRRCSTNLRLLGRQTNPHRFNKELTKRNSLTSRSNLCLPRARVSTRLPPRTAGLQFRCPGLWGPMASGAGLAIPLLPNADNFVGLRPAVPPVINAFRGSFQRASAATASPS